MEQSIGVDTTQERKDDLTLHRTTIKNSESLLYKIGIAFGLDYSETANLVKQVYAETTYAETTKNKIEQEHPGAIRICLSKLMIYKCIFIISSKLFGQGTGDNDFTSLKYYSDYNSSSITRTPVMPLSYRAAYILHHDLGFTEAEVAKLLNITTVKVKERINKARYFINNSKNGSA
jgi:hypothetical protein